MASRFELDKFAIEPSVHQFNICRKEDLLSIADLYQIQVTRGARKQDIKKVICRLNVGFCLKKVKVRRVLQIKCRLP